MTSHTSQTLERCSHNLGSAALPPCHILAEDKAGTTGRDHLGWMFRAQNGGKHGENPAFYRGEHGGYFREKSGFSLE